MKRAARVVDRARQRHAHADHLPLVHAALVEHPRDQLGSLLERSVGVLVHVHPDARLGDHGAGEVAHRHADLVVVEVEADGGAGRRVERELRGRAALAAGGGERALHDQAGALELADHGRDRGRRQAGLPCDVGAACGSVVAEGIHYAQSVELTQ